METDISISEKRKTDRQIWRGEEGGRQADRQIRRGRKGEMDREREGERDVYQKQKHIHMKNDTDVYRN